MADDKDRAQRRVYVLPNDLVDRVVAYQSAMGLPSEVEAVRRLLDSALQHRDTLPQILDRLRERFKTEKDLRILAAEVLMPHALITSVRFDSEGRLRFTMRGHGEGAMDERGNTFTTDFEGRRLYPYPENPNSGPIPDDEIPF